ncbi:MAG: SAM-dependent methyltransferase [Nocardioidaceae bacterium]
MAEPLLRALSRVRGLLLDEVGLVRAVASGRQRAARPAWRRVELRYVDLKAGRRLQVTTYDETQAHTANHAPGEPARQAVDELLDEPFGNWHVETTTHTHQLRVTKKLEAMTHTADRALAAAGAAAATGTGDPTPQRATTHDRAKPRLLPPDDPVLAAMGFLDDRGRLKPSRQAKYRQVEEFLRDLVPVVDDAIVAGRLVEPTPERPLRVVDLGCGNAYLTFAAHRYLGHVRGLPVHTTGIDVKEQSRLHNSEMARSLGLAAEMTFLEGDIGTTETDDPPDVVLALHACDTATDDALARAVAWQAPVVLAAPCCHHDVAAQLRRATAPAPYALLTRSGILRERFADTLTDAMRAAVLRTAGYRVEVIDFVDSRHTPRNTLLRAVRTGGPTAEGVGEELAELTAAWGVRPRLMELLRERG